MNYSKSPNVNTAEPVKPTFFINALAKIGVELTPDELSELKSKVNAVWMEDPSKFTHTSKGNQPLFTDAEVEAEAYRVKVQNELLGDFLKFFTFIFGADQVFPFQRKLIHFLNTGEIPEEWKSAPEAFFRWNGVGLYGDICILIPRSFRKTTLGVALQVWFYLRDMRDKTLFTHNDLTLSMKNLTLVKNTVLNSSLAKIFPDRIKATKKEYYDAGGRVTQKYLSLNDKITYPDDFNEAKEGNFEATALTQDLASQHFHRVYGDDLIVWETSKSPEATQAVSDYIDSLSFLAVNLNKGIHSIYTGTQWGEGNYYERLKVREAPITIIQMPAAWGIIDEGTFQYENYLCPELVDRTGLDNMYKKTQDKRQFWSQMFMRPIPLGGDSAPLTDSMDFVIPLSDRPEYDQCYNFLCIDPISREKDHRRPGKSKGVAVQVSVYKQKLYVDVPLTVLSIPDISDYVTKVVNLIKVNHIDYVIVESIHAQRWLLHLLQKELNRKNIKCGVTSHKHLTGKSDHIYRESGLQALFDASQILVTDNNVSLIKQIVGQETFGDELDALSFFPSEISNWEYLKPPDRKQKVDARDQSIFGGSYY